MHDRHVKGSSECGSHRLRQERHVQLGEESINAIHCAMLLDHRVQGWCRVAVVTIVGVVSSGVPAFWSASIAFVDLVIWMSGLELPGGVVPRSRLAPAPRQQQIAPGTSLS
jgi:hypothetical protein